MGSFEPPHISQNQEALRKNNQKRHHRMQFWSLKCIKVHWSDHSEGAYNALQ